MPRRPSTPATEVERTIQFFRADVGQDEGGRPHVFDPDPLINIVQSLEFAQGDNSRYFIEGDDSDLCLHVDTPRKFRLGRVRRGSLPMVERAGSIESLAIDPDSGLHETIHIVVFDNNIVGADYNHYGPRLSRLSAYLVTKCKLQPGEVLFNPLLKYDSLQEFEQLSEIRVLNLKVRPAFIEPIRQIDRQLGDAFANARQLIGDTGGEVQLVLQPDRRGRAGLLERLGTSIVQIGMRADLRANATQFQVKGTDRISRKVETVDLLSDRLVKKKKIVRFGDRNRAVDADSA